MALTLNNQILYVSGGALQPNINAFYGPYSSIANAITALKAVYSESTDIVPAGLTIAIKDSTSITEYWLLTDVAGSSLATSSFTAKQSAGLKTQALTSAEYAALTTKDANTLYLVIG